MAFAVFSKPMISIANLLLGRMTSSWMQTSNTGVRHEHAIRLAAACLGVASHAEQVALPGQQRVACHRREDWLRLERLLLPILRFSRRLLEAHLPLLPASRAGGLGRGRGWVMWEQQRPGQLLQVQAPDIIQEAPTCKWASIFSSLCITAKSCRF